MNIFITGANRGLGLELVKAAVERGHSVFAAARTLSPDSKLAKLQQIHGSRIKIVLFDVADEEAIARCAGELKSSGATVDAIVNNAGILVERNVSIEELDIAGAARTFDVNVLGPIRVVKHLLPIMSGEGGAIINVSSDAGSLHRAYGGDYSYGISKTALNMFTEQLKHAVKGRDIVVYSVHPGWMKTDMGGSQAAMEPHESAHGILDLIERRRVPEGRFAFVDYKGTPMEI